MAQPAAARYGLAPWRWPSRLVHGLLFVLLAAWAVAQCLGPLGTRAATTHDLLVQWRLWASAPDPRLLIVDIDERSLAEMAPEFGRWPWPRDTLASVLAHAEAQGAAALVFDILFSDPDRLHPGGDHALAAAAAASRIALYPVVRLPSALDAGSALRADQVPGLAHAVAPTGPAPGVALVLPFMRPMVDSGRLGTHSVQRDADGKLRRFAFEEPLADGWRLRSMPAAVAAHQGRPLADDGVARTIVWRRHADAYPRVPFSQLWACAEGRSPAGCPDLRGRILVLGATAPSLHDLHATPLSSRHAGVDVLATLIDNALHGRQLHELSPAWRLVLALAALALAAGLAHRGSTGATQRALILLPPLLLGLGYASLHSEWLYLDLQLPATLALSYLGAVTAFGALRAWRLGARAMAMQGPMALACGAPAATGERLQRTLLDLAARRQLAVSGLSTACGHGGAAHTLWVVWGLDDEPACRALAAAVQRAVPGVWHTTFAVGDDATRDLHQAVATALPPQPAKAVPLSGALHAT